MVPLFKGAHAAAGSKEPVSPDPQDVVFFAGGTVWSLDWCPSPPDARGQEASTQYLAVSILTGNLLLLHPQHYLPSWRLITRQ